MPIPDYQSLMLPLLRFASDGNDHTTREAVEVLANEFQLTSTERSELLASGQQAIFNNRVGWANSYLKKSGLLESPGEVRFESQSVESRFSTNNHNGLMFDSWNGFPSLSNFETPLGTLAEQKPQSPFPPQQNKHLRKLWNSRTKAFG
jgi:restriction endonuclease Mrr